MTNEIMEAISIALNAEFNTGECSTYEIYREEIKQGLKRPCFFIASSEHTFSRFRGSRYLRRNTFMIEYYPESEDKQLECHKVAGRMENCLEFITCAGDDKPIIATGMKHETVEGVLYYTVSYDLYVVKQEEQESMESMEIQTSVKEGESGDGKKENGKGSGSGSRAE